MKVRRGAIVLFLGGALAGLSLFAAVGATGFIGHLTAEAWPNADRPDGGLPTDAPPPADDPSTTCAAPVTGDPLATGPDPAPPDLSATCGANDTGPGGPAPSDTLPNGPPPDGTYGGAPTSAL